VGRGALGGRDAGDSRGARGEPSPDAATVTAPAAAPSPVLLLLVLLLPVFGPAGSGNPRRVAPGNH